MHIPDGFLDAKTATASAVLSVAALAVALRRARTLPPRRVPLMGLAAAFVFAAQMLNFPIGGGTSGHLIGGVLCSVLLGPSAAVLVITCVLIVQCFVFADGGVTALGANVFNMAIVSSVGGYLIYSSVRRMLPGQRGRLVAVAVASWLSTVTAAAVCAGQLALSHVVPWKVALPAMAGVHMLIGVGEALITTLVIFALSQARPELLDDSLDSISRQRGFAVVASRSAVLPEKTDPPPISPSLVAEGSSPEFAQRSSGASGLVYQAENSPAPRLKFDVIAFGLLLALGLAIFLSPFASTAPDGLDHVAESLGFRERETSQRAIPAPAPDYHLPGIKSPAIATALAGGIGTLVVFVAGWVLAKVLVPTLDPLGATPNSAYTLTPTDSNKDVDA